MTFPLAAFVRAFFEDYLVCQRNVSVRTIQSYRDSMRLFLRFMAERTRKNPSQLLVADITGKDAKSGQPARLLAAVVPRSGETWFYKLMGNAEVVQQQKDAFMKFVQGVKY